MVKKEEDLSMNNSIRFAILERDNFTCQYCGKGAPEVKLDVDHVIPHSKGGKDESTNLVTACKLCNLHKGNKDIRPLVLPKRIQLPKQKTESYKGKCIKMHEDTWEKFKEARRKSGLSWNQFILSLIEKKKK